MRFKKHPFWYLGFLSLFSLLYFFGVTPGILGFLGFAGYFGIYKENDERLERAIGKSAVNGFLWSAFSGAILLGYILLFERKDLIGIAFTVVFSGNIMVTLLSYFIYEKK